MEEKIKQIHEQIKKIEINEELPEDKTDYKDEFFSQKEFKKRTIYIENVIEEARKLNEKNKNNSEKFEFLSNEEIIKEILNLKKENEILSDFHKLKNDESVCMITLNSNGKFFQWTHHFLVNYNFQKKGNYRL